MNNNEKMNSFNKRQTNRSIFGRCLFLFCIGVFLLIALRFTYIAIFKKVNNVNLSEQAKELYTKTNVIRAKRGTIYDSGGQPLAEDSNTYNIYIQLYKSENQKDSNGRPLYVTDKSKVAQALSKTLPISYKKVMKIISNKKAFQVEIGSAGKNISVTTKNKIDKYNVTGIHFEQQQSRLYPNGIFASHIIGYASGNGNGDLVGQMGIEKQFNKLLTGKNGLVHIQKDYNGVQLPNTKSKGVKAKNGNNIYTTLDYRLQSLLETEMSNVNSEVHPSTMNAILMNAKTGDILAASQRPTFNATNMEGIGDIWRNTLWQDSYEPGSTMKIFTMASSINSGNYNGNDTYLSGRYAIDGKIVPDWNTNGWGRITYDKGFALSSNVAMAHLEQQMGSKTWSEYINKFKFLRTTNSGFDGEQSGSMQFKYPIEQANTAFGQGIQVTALQMIQALSSIANNGYMLKPRFISKIDNPNNDKVIKQYNKQVVGHPISAKTAKKVIKHMEDVVYKPYGIGSDYKIPGYKIAAKTGTAQVSDGRSGYASGDDSYLYSVAGIAPANNPKYILYITMKQPRLTGTKTPTQLMAQIFNPVMKLALEEDVNANNSSDGKIPDVSNMDLEKAKNILTTNDYKYAVLGNGNEVIDQSISAGQIISKARKVILMTDGVKTMNNLKHWSKYDVYTYCHMAGIKLNAVGDGYAYKQSLSPGELLTSGKKVTVKFK
ncbi:cell division protein FtsI [Apilactobacillus ozensis DSM 23829 = JCM 17196]|uniref:Cell division protein FtsI n=1 Tax=Apilactobacillus ozensis DSM 23829 = JCM 17196 TaxID=1423781 RepID=A0A0R2AYG8_9LACO|nr:penicillin-binding transpeptidase domain-containing protein [Apilactobacillus ozensis]KRM68630.1 cell division protein FtsI [Apilactobacillus ozensis DSM 23829 = JCM 17196]